MMSQRNSGYERKDGDFYETPEWVTEALLPHLHPIDENGSIWEPAAGSGKMVRVLTQSRIVWGSDISWGDDFLTSLIRPANCITAIITNPPYGKAEEFICRAL